MASCYDTYKDHNLAIILALLRSPNDTLASVARLTDHNQSKETGQSKGGFCFFHTNNRPIRTANMVFWGGVASQTTNHIPVCG